MRSTQPSESKPVSRVRLVSLLLALLAAAPAAGAPAVSIKTKLVTATVEIDSELSRFPGLSADCLAEGRRWAAERRAEAEKVYRTSPEMFRADQPWSLERDYTARSVIGRYVSVVRTDHTYTGGAHPNSHLDTILWDTASKRRINVRRFFKESVDNGPTMTTLARAARQAVAAEKKSRDVPVEDDPDKDTWLQGIKASLLELGPVSLAPSTERGKSSGLTIHFSPYAVGAYVEGPYTVFIPWKTFASFLSAEGAALFGGERPADDDNW
jgi:hypothetical protein